MTKGEMKEIADEVREGKTYPEADVSPLFGLALPSFEEGKPVSKKSAVNHVMWQAQNMDGSIDEDEMMHNLNLMKEKKVTII